MLTGFKFIGEQIGKLEQQGKADSYVFGFEESYGYLTGLWRSPRYSGCALSTSASSCPPNSPLTT